MKKLNANERGVFIKVFVKVLNLCLTQYFWLKYFKTFWFETDPRYEGYLNDYCFRGLLNYFF